LPFGGKEGGNRQQIILDRPKDNLTQEKEQKRPSRIAYPNKKEKIGGKVIAIVFSKERESIDESLGEVIASFFPMEEKRLEQGGAWKEGEKKGRIAPAPEKGKKLRGPGNTDSIRAQERVCDATISTNHNEKEEGGKNLN